MITQLRKRLDSGPSAYEGCLPIYEVAAALRLSEYSYDEEHLKTLRNSAIDMLEERTGQDLKGAVWEYYLEHWPQERILTLPRYPVTAIHQVEYLPEPCLDSLDWQPLKGEAWPFYASADSWQAIGEARGKMAASTGMSDGWSHLSVLLPAKAYLPALSVDAWAARVRVVFVTLEYAFGMPAALKTAALMRIADLYDGRTEPNPALESLILQNRVGGFCA